MKNGFEKPAATLLATATLLAGVSLPPAAIAAPTGGNPAASTPAQPDGESKDHATDQGDATVAWSLLGVTLTPDDKGTLVLPEGQTLPAFNARPDDISVEGSDGATIPLTLTGTTEEHPKLGLTTGTGTLSAEATDTLPAVDIPVSWATGMEITLSDGTPFAQGADGVWEAEYGRTLTLKDDNEPPVRNIGLSDDSKTGIKWGEPTLKDGKVMRRGEASGEIQGQKWKARITAERATDHTSLAQAITAAQQAYDQGGAEYTSASLTALGDVIEEAVNLDGTAATDEAMQAMEDRLAETVGKLETVTWSVGKTRLAHEPGQGYEGKAPNTLGTAPSGTQALTSNDPTLGKLGSIAIDRAKDDAQPSYSDEDLGVIRATGTARYSGVTPNGNRAVTWSQDYSYTIGERVSATGPGGKDIGFTKADGYLTATVTASLDQENQPKDTTVTIDGKPVAITWSNEVRTTADATTSTFTRQGRVEGDLTVTGTDRTQHWVVYVNATRTEGHVASLSVIQRQADGTGTEHTIEGFDPAKTDYTITLPANAVADQYTLGHTSAAGDQAQVSEGKPIPPTLGENASRILKATLNGVTYTVTVNFDQATPTPENPNARLRGLYVNLTGKTEKGTLIDGWNPDVLDYTIRIGADDPGAYILPEAPAGVTVKAGDVKRTGYATTQYWTTQSPDGQSRTYSVTVIRDHEQPTAEEAFKPGAAEDADGKTPPPSRSDTSLASHGYLLNGEYHAVEDTDYTIPEGGAFAYASKQGQTVRVSESKTGGMTWRYTLNILAPDGVTIANPAPAFTVTYLTKATHEAAITNIIVDGKPINGFDPNKHGYETQVDNLDHWTVNADFDKTTGMGVTIHKEHDHATITAVSADGLNKTTYTLKVSEKPLSINRAGVDGATVEGLARTGVNSASMISVVAVLLAAGIACLAAGLTRRLRRGKRVDDRTGGDSGEDEGADAE